MTLRSILVPLDGSPFGEHALPYALGLARRAQAKLELAHTQEPVSAFDVPAVSTPEEDWRATEQAHAYLAEVAQGVKAASPSVVVTTTLLHGEAADALHKYPDVARPENVFLTTTVADKVIRGATVPVLLQRPTDD